MAEFVGRRILQIIPVLLGVSILVFFMVRAIPGDPAQILLGQNATEAQTTTAHLSRQTLRPTCSNDPFRPGHSSGRVDVEPPRLTTLSGR